MIISTKKMDGKNDNYNSINTKFYIFLFTLASIQFFLLGLFIYNVSQIFETVYVQLIGISTVLINFLFLIIGLKTSKLYENSIKSIKQSLENITKTGDLNQRFSNKDIPKEFTELTNSINNMLDSFAIPINNIKESTKRISDGDLTKRVSHQNLKGDIKDVVIKYNVMISSLHKKIDSIIHDIYTVSTISKEIHSSSKSLKNSIEDLSLVSKNHDFEKSNGVLSKDKLDEFNVAFQTYQGIIRNIIKKMDTIQTNIKDNHSKFTLISENIIEISRFYDYINKIREKSKLLALNATIEVSHAGDSAGGFVIIADELRNLANQCNQITYDLNKFKNEIQTKINERPPIKDDLALDILCNDIDNASHIMEFIRPFVETINSEDNTTLLKKDSDNQICTSSYKKYFLNVTQELCTISDELADFSVILKSKINDFTFDKK